MRTPPGSWSAMPCVPRESCCTPQAELSSLPAGKINEEWFLIKGRERELWLLPVRDDFRGQSLWKKKIICCGKGEVCILTGYRKRGAGQAMCQQDTASLVPLLRVLANLPPSFCNCWICFSLQLHCFSLVSGRCPLVRQLHPPTYLPFSTILVPFLHLLCVPWDVILIRQSRWICLSKPWERSISHLLAELLQEQSWCAGE